MWQMVCTIGTLHAYMTYKIILTIFNQHEKIAASTFILNLPQKKKKNIYIKLWFFEGKNIKRNE